MKHTSATLHGNNSQLIRHALSIPLLICALTACFEEDDPVPATNGGAAAQQAANAATGGVLGKYDLFNQCFVMKADNAYVVRSGNTFSASGTDATGAEKFFMRAANLARYLFYTPDEMLMTASGSNVSVVPQSAPEDGSDWAFEETGDGALTASTLSGSLAVGQNNTLELGSSAARLEFEPTTGCAIYPEMPLGVIGQTFKGDASQPVIGFAEVHAHMSQGDQLWDGDPNNQEGSQRGPAAAGVLYGHAIDRFGVTEALKNCAAIHGEDGTADPEAVILDTEPGKRHDTQGWPSFVDWPFRDSQLHQQMYWRWVERAWMAGMRTMTMLATNIEALCEFGRDSGPNRGATVYGPNGVDCKDMSIGMKQIAFLQDIQNYIDAQYGGPGKGFLRLVGSPQQAREVIADGKLAVIPGLEFSNLFRCNLTWEPNEVRHCTKAQIDQEIDEAWAAGIREVFPFHDVDSALGGAGLFSETLNLVNFYGTNKFWETYPCENGGVGDTYFFEAGFTPSSDPFASNEPFGVSSLLAAIAAGRAPIYPAGNQCNARSVTDLGAYAIDKVMKKGFIVHIDHAAFRSKQKMLDYGGTMTPPYPMVSGHGGHGGISNAQARQLLAQGGIIYPANKNGKDHVDFIAKVKTQWEASGTPRPLSVGYGADANGLRDLPGPRGMARIMATQPVTYPFQLFTGPGWGPQFDNIAPITVQRLEIPLTGGKIWDVNEGGMYHYGLIADIIEEIRIEGGQPAIDAFYNSAETYLQLWEQTLLSAADARTKPTPDNLP